MCAPLVSPVRATPALAQGVEIIAGTMRGAGPSPDAPGIRTIAFVQFEPPQTVYEVMRPVRADEILSIQVALAAVGHDPVSRDGILGPSTTQALAAFQGDRGLEPCGCVDYPTVISLGLRAQVVQTVIGSPEDESSAEIVVPPGRLSPARAAAAPPEPPVDTVRVLEGGPPYWWWGGLGFFAGFPPGRLGPPGPSGGMIGRGGVPFGPGITLGRSASTIRSGPPPPPSGRPPGR